MNNKRWPTKMPVDTYVEFVYRYTYPPLKFDRCQNLYIFMAQSQFMIPRSLGTLPKA